MTLRSLELEGIGVVQSTSTTVWEWLWEKCEGEGPRHRGGAFPFVRSNIGGYCPHLDL